jgi:histidinol phosphatase-like PHP family hydrolase
VPLTNAELAELLARQSEIESGVLVRAFRRAARNALFWPESAATLVAQKRTLVELSAIGPFIEKRVKDWIENPQPALGTIPPIRRDFCALADSKSFLKKKPEWEKSLRGDLQMHTCWSDGSGTVAAMATAARERGYEYIVITDHSKGLKIAGGIDERALREQAGEIAETNRAILRGDAKLTVLRSIEMNLNPRGEGDMDPKSLSGLDLVLGSFHSSLRRTDDQTERYMAALRNPHIQILAHPRGRIYNFRLGLKADWPRVFAEATKLDKALEIDCYPDRQDLNVTLLKLARSAGTRVSLGTDAHHPWQLEFIQLGLAAALRAKIPAKGLLISCRFSRSSGGLHDCVNEAANPGSMNPMK